MTIVHPKTANTAKGIGRISSLQAERLRDIMAKQKAHKLSHKVIQVLE